MWWAKQSLRANVMDEVIPVQEGKRFWPRAIHSLTCRASKIQWLLIEHSVCPCLNCVCPGPARKLDSVCPRPQWSSESPGLALWKGGSSREGSSEEGAMRRDHNGPARTFVIITEAGNSVSGGDYAFQGLEVVMWPWANPTIAWPLFIWYTRQ